MSLEPDGGSNTIPENSQVVEHTHVQFPWGILNKIPEGVLDKVHWSKNV